MLVGKETQGWTWTYASAHRLLSLKYLLVLRSLRVASTRHRSAVASRKNIYYQVASGVNKTIQTFLNISGK